MDQLLAKIKETQPLYQSAEHRVQESRRALARDVDDAYKCLQTLHQAEYELLVSLIAQRQQYEDRATRQQDEITRLMQQIKLEPIREDPTTITTTTTTDEPTK